MNILLIAPHPFYQHRGTPIAVKLVITVLSGTGHHLTLLTLPEGEDPKIPNCRILRVPRIPGVSRIKPGFSWKKGIYDIILLHQTTLLLHRSPYDLLHTVEEAAFIGVYAKKRFGIPFVYDMDSSLSDQLVEMYPGLSVFSSLFRFLEKRLIRESAGVLPVCRALEDRVKRVAPEKVIQRLEDISLLDFNGMPQDAAETLTITGKPVIMYIGNLEKYQGIDLLINAFRIASSGFPDARLVIVGGTKRDVARYQKICRDKGFADKTLFLGQQPISRLKSLFFHADILVSPRIAGNNTPMKIYSYLDSGKPVLATRLPTHTQVLNDEIALLAEPNPHALCRGLLRLMEDENLRERLARNAADQVRRHYSFPAFQRKLCGFYEKMENQIAQKGMIP
ncbi:MAG: glycosyltransferase family 4 protein [Deltaproteobacteria bacterium]|nr:glycosyltransferase family 4 protein [Deltaproteobacteria bacterium]MBW2132873.1 glycosyltransferase family 4 protein [Deltaproteobacteria bacterium]